MDRMLGKFFIGGMAVLCGGMGCGDVLAQTAIAGVPGDTPQERPLGADWVPIDPARLADMRGGFLLPSGLVLSFGIERAVYVNGELTASTSLRIADMSRITADDAKAVARFNEGLVVQIGDGNHFDPVSLPGGVVIQNTLNDQHIVTVTQMDVRSGALRTFQDLNAAGAIQDGLINSAGTR